MHHPTGMRHGRVAASSQLHCRRHDLGSCAAGEGDSPLFRPGSSCSYASAHRRMSSIPGLQIKALIVCAEIGTDSVAGRTAGGLVVERQQLDVSVIVARSARDAAGVLVSERDIHIAVVDWDLTSNDVEGRRGARGGGEPARRERHGACHARRVLGRDVPELLRRALWLADLERGRDRKLENLGAR
jgi:hypothetical protein